MHIFYIAFAIHLTDYIIKKLCYIQNKNIQMKHYIQKYPIRIPSDTLHLPIKLLIIVQSIPRLKKK